MDQSEASPVEPLVALRGDDPEEEEEEEEVEEEEEEEEEVEIRGK